MRLKPQHIRKADPPLQEALERATGSEVLRAVMLLSPVDGSGNPDEVGEPLHPVMFPSYKEYRRALIDRLQHQTAQDIGETLQELERLSLTPIGGEISWTVIVQGPARRILQSLELPGVRYANLDRSIQLPELVS